MGTVHLATWALVVLSLGAMIAGYVGELSDSVQDTQEESAD